MNFLNSLHKQKSGKSTVNIIAFIAIIVIVVFILVRRDSDIATPLTNTSNPTDTSVKSSETNHFTLEDVAQHTTPDDCWLAIDGIIYDVTAFIASGKHGGGDAILQGCGIDATELYETRPMGSGTPHSETARSFLPNFAIGALVN